MIVGIRKVAVGRQDEQQRSSPAACWADDKRDSSTGLSFRRLPAAEGVDAEVSLREL